MGENKNQNSLFWRIFLNSERKQSWPKIWIVSLFPLTDFATGIGFIKPGYRFIDGGALITNIITLLEKKKLLFIDNITGP